MRSLVNTAPEGSGPRTPFRPISDSARNPDLGHKAIEQLKGELKPEEHSKIRFHQLDITDEASAINFRDYLQKEHGGFDILINNAGAFSGVLS